MEPTSDFVDYLVPRLIGSLRDPDGELERRVGTWIAYTVRFSPRYDVKYVDLGYDCSAHVERSDYDLSSVYLETVSDFLAQPNGHTIATYLSGSGLAASVYSDDLSEQVSDALHAIVTALVAAAPEPVRSAFEAAEWGHADVMHCDLVGDAVIAWECALRERPLAAILTRFEFAARRRRQLEEESASKERARRAARQALAAPLIALLCTLVRRRIEANAQDVLWAACRKVARAATSRAQWQAFVEEAPSCISLSSHLGQRFPEMAEAIWSHVRGSPRG